VGKSIDSTTGIFSRLDAAENAGAPLFQNALGFPEAPRTPLTDGGGSPSPPGPVSPGSGSGSRPPAPQPQTGSGTAAAASFAPGGGAGAPGEAGGRSGAAPAPAQAGVVARPAVRPSSPVPLALAGPSIPENAWSLPDGTIGNGSPAAQGSFPYYPMYVLDYDNAIVLFPGQYQEATLGGSVDLRAQVRDTTGVTFSWDTSHLSYANSITGTSTYNLKFNWNSNNFGSSGVVYTTLTVTNGASQQESQTYYFNVPLSNVVTLPSSASWPETLPPDTVRPEAPAFDSHNLSVDANTGAVDATIPLPSYNPNVPGLALTYDSLTADPRPIVLEHHTLDATQSAPTKVSAQLTFNSVAGTAYYYNTSQFTPGDIESIALQADATGLSTGRYSYSVQVVDYRTTNTTFTLNGTATVLNNASSALGAGWTLQGLEKITSASGGVILDVGNSGKNLWFTGSGGTYTDPPGEFSTLVKNGDNTYTRTLTDGTTINFDTGGHQTSVVDRNGLRTTVAYSSGLLSTITDPYAKVTTFNYSGGALQSIADPAGRLTTFTISGGTLNQVQQADGSLVSLTYDAAKRLTQLKDPNGNAVTAVYDGAERASTITRPDGTTETFKAYQERGYDTSGTSANPAAPTLLAEARASHTDPNNHTTDLRSDWGGLGLANQATDPDGNVTSLDLNSNGLAAVSVDRLNRIDQYTYDSKGNVTTRAYPDLNTDKYTYNSFSEPLTHTDANNHTTTYGYDGNGNLTSIQDPLNNRTTMTYTANGRLQTVKDARNNVTSLQYDTQDRLTTIAYSDATTNLRAYDSKGNAVTVTDERGSSTTYSYDALNRKTGMTDALGNRTIYGYDAVGNITSQQAPLSRTTTYAYDSMNRLTTVTDPLAHSTVYGYDPAGNLQTVKDPLGRVTTFGYDPEDRLNVVTDALGNRATTTYDAEGQKLTVTDALNRTASYSYSNRGFVSTVTDPLGFVVTYVYTPTGQISVTANIYSSTNYSYDALDRLTAVTDPLNHTTTYTFDAVGNKIAVTDALAHTVSLAYDSRNRMASITDALNNVTTIGYDAAGNQQTVTDPLGHTATTLYDALNRPATVIDARGATTSILYDAAGRRTGLIDPVGNRTTWSYDAADRLTTMVDPLNHAATYVYDNANQLTDQTDRDGRRTTFAYDNDGRMTGETWVGGSRSITYVYDAAGQMTGATDPSATLTFAYDNDGRMTTAVTSGPGTGQPTVTLTYAFDHVGNRTNLTDSLSSQGVTTYQYDSAFRVTTIARSIGGSVKAQVVYGYDAANRLTSIKRTATGSNSDPVTGTTLVYDNGNRLTTQTHQYYTVFGPPSYTALATYVYGYDNANRLTSEQDKEGTATFTYDNANELTAVGGSRTETYSFDLNGNRNSSGYTTGGNNELTAAPNMTYAYDNEGNLTSETNTSTHVTTSFTYDYRNRMVSVMQGGSTIATYTYDALNRRIGFKVNGTQTWTVYDGKSASANPYGDFDGSGNLKMRYLYGLAVDELLARTDSSAVTAWYLPDRLGTIRDIANTSGSVIDHVVYTSFGGVTSESNSANGDRFKFTGREYGSEAGLYYFRARFYDPSAGRFVELDPRGFRAGDPSLYRYLRNAPDLATDPSGEISLDGYAACFPDLGVGEILYRVLPISTEALAGASDTTLVVGTGVVVTAVVLASWGTYSAISAYQATVAARAAAAAAAAAGPALAQSGGKLQRIAEALTQAYESCPPMTRDAGLELVQRAAASVNLEPGRIANLEEYLAGGPAVLQNVGAVTTTILLDGTIVIERAGQVILRLSH
jgi:RHS repeat-associated protein